MFDDQGDFVETPPGEFGELLFVPYEPVVEGELRRTMRLSETTKNPNV